jgi:hypothetical protein
MALSTAPSSDGIDVRLPVIQGLPGFGSALK